MHVSPEPFSSGVVHLRDHAEQVMSAPPAAGGLIAWLNVRTLLMLYLPETGTF